MRISVNLANRPFVDKDKFLTTVSDNFPARYRGVVGSGKP